MKDYELVESNHPLLSQEIPTYNHREVYDADGVNPWELAEKMVEVMRSRKGLGLSANQLGLPYRVFVMEGEPALACFNPRIVDTSSDLIALEEGCLSFPHLYVKVKRPRFIKVRFQDPNGDTHTLKLDGISARVFQHELDHLNGVDFRKRANRYHLEKAIKQKKKLDKGVLRADPSMVIQALKAAGNA